MNNDFIVHGDLAGVVAIPSAITGWEAEFTLLNDGGLETDVTMFQNGPLQFSRATIDKGIVCTGEAPEGHRTFLIRLETNTQYKTYGRDINADEILIIPPSRELDLVSKSNVDNVTISLPNAYLEEISQSRNADNLFGLLDPSIFFRPPPTMLMNLKELLFQASDAINAMTSPKILTSIREAIVSSFTACLTSACPVPSRFTASSRKTAVARAMKCIHETGNDPISLAALCNAAGVSQRTLLYAFKECIGISPKAYAKNYRLNRAYQALRNKEIKNVTEVAVKYGFWHMGQFSADYKKLFGELPSKTLQDQNKPLQIHIPNPTSFEVAL